MIFSFYHPAGVSSSQPVIQEATFRTQSHPKRTRGSHPGPKNTQESQSIWRRSKLILNQVFWDLISHAVTELSSKPDLNWSSQQIHNPCFLWPALPLASLGRLAFLPSELYLPPSHVPSALEALRSPLWAPWVRPLPRLKSEACFPTSSLPGSWCGNLIVTKQNFPNCFSKHTDKQLFKFKSVFQTWLTIFPSWEFTLHILKLWGNS